MHLSKKIQRALISLANAVSIEAENENFNGDALVSGLEDVISASLNPDTKIHREISSADPLVPYNFSADMICSAYDYYKNGEFAKALKITSIAFENSSMEDLSEALASMNENAEKASDFLEVLKQQASELDNDEEEKLQFDDENFDEDEEVIENFDEDELENLDDDEDDELEDDEDVEIESEINEDLYDEELDEDEDNVDNDGTMLLDDEDESLEVESEDEEQKILEDDDVLDAKTSKIVNANMNSILKSEDTDTNNIDDAVLANQLSIFGDDKDRRLSSGLLKTG